MKKNQLHKSLELQELKNKFSNLENILNRNNLDDNEPELTPRSIQNNIKINIFYRELENKDVNQRTNNLLHDEKEENIVLLNLNRIIIYNLLIDIKNNISIINFTLNGPCSFFNFYKKYIKNRKLKKKKKLEIEKEKYLDSLINSINENLSFYN